MGNEYPKCAYIDGGSETIWGAAVKTRLLRSADEEEEALASGWRLHPIGGETTEQPKRRGRPPLNRNAADA